MGACCLSAFVTLGMGNRISVAWCRDVVKDRIKVEPLVLHDKEVISWRPDVEAAARLITPLKVEGIDVRSKPERASVPMRCSMIETDS